MSEHQPNDIELLRYIDTIIADLRRLAAVEEDEWDKGRIEKDIRELKQIRARWYGQITGEGAQ